MEVIGSLIIAISQSILFYGKEIGISMFIFTLISIGIIWYILYKQNKIVNKKALILMLPILLLGSTYFIFANGIFNVINVLVILLLTIVMFVIATSKKNYFKEYLENSLSIIKDSVHNLNKSMEVTKKSTQKIIKGNSKINKDIIKKWAVSLFIVFIVVGFVIMLLASADSIFASIFSGFGDLFRDINEISIWKFIFRVAIVIIVYCIALGFIIALQDKEEKQAKEVKTVHNKDKFTIKMLLVVLNIVYLVFCYIQVNSLFAKVNLAGTFNYAEYARSGFFQLMFVSFINFVLILISNNHNEKREKFIKILNLFLIVFTIIIVLSSMYRMYMYEIEYGLTYLRTFVFIILGTELLVFIPTVMYILSSKFDLLKWGGIIVLCVYVSINFARLDNIIINNNINRTNSKVDVDYDYICAISSTDNYEILEKILNENNLNTKEKLRISRTLLNITNDSKDMKWQEFNISKYKLISKEVDTEELENQIDNLEDILQKEREEKMSASYTKSNYIYDEMLNNTEGYRVDQVDAAGGTAFWKIEKTTNGGLSYSKINTITVSSPSKIKFFKNGLGFLEKPSSIYCESAELYVTYDSGKNFDKIEFSDGKFTLSNPNGKEWSECYDYFYLPTMEGNEDLVVLASGGYEGGYNDGQTRAKYISRDNGRTWIFEGEVVK